MNNDSQGENFLPVGNVFPDLQFPAMPEGTQTVDAFIMVKTIDADGDRAWLTRQTSNYNHSEFLGALIAYTDYLRADEAAGWSDEEGRSPTP